MLEVSFLKASRALAEQYLAQASSSPLRVKLPEREYSIEQSKMDNGSTEVRIEKVVETAGGHARREPLGQLVWDAQTRRVSKLNNEEFCYFDLLTDEAEKVRAVEQYYAPCVQSRAGSQRPWVVVQEGFCKPVQFKEVAYTPEKVLEKFYIQTPRGEQLRKEELNGKETYRAWFGSDGS